MNQERSQKVKSENILQKNSFIIFFSFLIIMGLGLLILCNNYFVSPYQQKYNTRHLQYNWYKPCPQNHTITYVWMGDSSKLRQKYKHYLNVCKNTTKLIGQQEFTKYKIRWNSQIVKNKTDSIQYINEQKLSNMNKVDMVKLLYLYYESGIYSDFDTQINEYCFQGVRTDQIIFTNWWGWSPKRDGIMVPQQSFIMVRKKYNPSLKQMIINSINEARTDRKMWRWNQCIQRQCLLLWCQRHFYDNAFYK